MHIKLIIYYILPDKLHKTKGIVLKTIKYGETSIVVSVYTELFGLQSYLVNGVRALSKKGNNKANFFQPASVLDMVVYCNDFKQLLRIKEYKWAQVHTAIFTDVLKNGVAQFIIELVWKSLKQPENNPELFAFVEDCLDQLNNSSDAVMANFPIFFAVQFTHLLGFAPRGKYAQVMEDPQMIFDLKEGLFTNEPSGHPYYLEHKYASLIGLLLRVRLPQELSQIQTNAQARNKILEALEIYYALHIPEFGKLKTLPVLQEILR